MTALRLAAILLLACVPDAVQWDRVTQSGITVPDGARLGLRPDGAPFVLAPWTPPVAPPGSASCGALPAAARARGDTAFAVWWAPRADSNATLVVARSTDGGHTWGAAAVADSADRGRSGCRRTPPSIEVDPLNGYVHVVYFMVAAEGPGVFCAHSMEGGTMFHAPVPVVYGDRVSAASVASWGDTVVVAYEDPNASVPQVWLAISRSVGHIFEQRASVSSSSASAARPSVVLRGDRIAVAWRETGRGDTTATEVLKTGTLRR